MSDSGSALAIIVILISIGALATILMNIHVTEQECVTDDYGTPIYENGKYSHCKIPNPPIYTDGEGNVVEP